MKRKEYNNQIRPYFMYSLNLPKDYKLIRDLLPPNIF